MILGYQSAQLLIDMLEGRKVKHKVVLPTELIIRDSTGPYRNSGIGFIKNVCACF